MGGAKDLMALAELIRCCSMRPNGLLTLQDAAGIHDQFRTKTFPPASVSSPAAPPATTKP